MDEIRTEKVSVNLTPTDLGRLDRYAEANVWTRSTAAAELIRRGLAAEEKEEDHDQAIQGV